LPEERMARAKSRRYHVFGWNEVNVRHGALVEVRIAPVRAGATSRVSLFGSNVDLANADSIMSLALDINGTTLSQSVTFRPNKSSFLFP
jgi:hypothetical protein